MKISKKKLVSVKDWDDLVSNTYGRLYSFQQQNGCQNRGTFHLTVPDGAEDCENDSVPEIVNGDKMGVSFKAWLARDPKQKLVGQQHDFELEFWWERNFYPSIQMVANDLYERKLLEAGEYIIEIDW